jgi:metal-responsive CopG/Arc/MetJ family transcriptional regulator
MKTAISLPDVLFRKAELRAKKLHISRSQLYAQALSEYLDRGDPEAVTASLNKVYAESGSEMDADFRDTQINLLKHVVW